MAQPVTEEIYPEVAFLYRKTDEILSAQGSISYITKKQNPRTQKPFVIATQHHKYLF